jgi:hypothetical protein
MLTLELILVQLFCGDHQCKLPSNDVPLLEVVCIILLHLKESLKR